MEENRGPFYRWLDFFRMAAATLVVISHVRDILLNDYSGQTLYLPFYALTGFGHSGVVVFFVLSGFWISRSVLGRLGQKNFWPAYLIDRLSRLEIVLLPALIIGGLLDYSGIAIAHLPIYDGTSGAHSVAVNIGSRLTMSGFVGNFGFLQTILVPEWGSNGPLWSLANEFWYYIWFPALALLVRSRRPSLALVSLTVAMANPGILLGFASWLVGLVLLLLLDRASLRLSAPIGLHRVRPFLATAAFLGLLLLSGAFKGGAMDFPLALAFGWFLYEIAIAAVRFPRWMVPLARFGSGSSFSLYVIHFPIVMLIGGYVTRQGRLAPSPYSVTLALLLTCLCIALAWLFSQMTERHTGLLRAALHRRLLPATVRN
jgi:peptidoglycan/LPS O-acetylase OafA/YrhL